jgi:tRNA(fMet)-specific endonuclease VapC
VFCVLDTNHYTEMIDGSTFGFNLMERANARKADIFTSVITAQEVTQGWLAEINRRKAGPEQLQAYTQFLNNLSAFSRLVILPFDDTAANIFLNLQRQALRVGSMDLKIAAICLAHDATVLTRNLVDFEKVPGLRVENWLD